MHSYGVLIGKLERSTGGDRRLDAEVMAAVLGPRGCVIDPIEGLDGWDIQYAPDADGEAACWREAADIPGLTLHLDAVAELLSECARPDAAAILARALRRLVEPKVGVSVEEAVGRTARYILIELLQTVADERRNGTAQAA